VMHYVWNGVWPENRTPQVQSFTINNKTAYENVILDANSSCLAILNISDFENDKLNYSWEILPESTDLQDGGDFEKRPSAVKFRTISDSEGELKFKVPEEKGAYRLFAYVDDGQQHAATANIPFKVN